MARDDVVMGCRDLREFVCVHKNQKRSPAVDLILALESC